MTNQTQEGMNELIAIVCSMNLRAYKEGKSLAIAECINIIKQTEDEVSKDDSWDSDEIDREVLLRLKAKLQAQMEKQ
jgi:hypothetical protein